jgi:hypothetical protein
MSVTGIDPQIMLVVGPYNRTIWKSPDSYTCVHSGYLRRKVKQTSEASSCRRSSQTEPPEAANPTRTTMHLPTRTFSSSLLPEIGDVRQERASVSGSSKFPQPTTNLKHVASSRPCAGIVEEQEKASVQGLSKLPQATTIRKDVVSSRPFAEYNSTKVSAVSSNMGRKSRRNLNNGIPRGLQVRAYATHDLSRGFPYPKALVLFAISRSVWNIFQHELTIPILQWRGLGGVSVSSKS